jgi:hypothetical protein
MVDVAQLVEPRIVIPAVAGSSPVVHPTFGCLDPCAPSALCAGSQPIPLALRTRSLFAHLAADGVSRSAIIAPQQATGITSKLTIVDPVSAR